MRPKPGDAARTVIRPPPGQRGDAFASHAGPLLALAARAARDPRPQPDGLAAEAQDLARSFEAASVSTGASTDAVADARDALLAVLDAKARSNPALRTRAWDRAIRRHLARADTSPARLRRAVSDADASGPGGRVRARFLRHCLEAVEATPPPPSHAASHWSVGLVLAAGLALGGWAALVEWHYARSLLATLPPVPTAASDAAGAARTLERFAAARAHVEVEAARSPLGLAQRLGRFGPTAAAERRYAEAAETLLPDHLADAAAVALATEGGSLALYDTLRVLSVLDGQAPWQAGFVSGWLAARAGVAPALGRLAPHVEALAHPPAALPPQDPVLLAQAREIAAEGDPAEFAYLEMARTGEARTIPDWSAADAVPSLRIVLVRRSGAPLAAGIDGLLTRAGWDHAVAGGADAAIDRMFTESGRVLGQGLPPPPVEAVLDTLQGRTLDAWQAYLGDLRVRPFTDQPASVLISGTLGRRATPLVPLFRAVWEEVGGADRSRSHANQLRIAATFGPIIQFVEAGGIAELSELFGALNVALAALDDDTEIGRRRIMNVQAQAASVAALQQAPRLVVQIVEDVLAQTAASQGDLLRPRAAQVWEREVAPVCYDAIGGAYPFQPGPDADLGAVADLVGPDGLLGRFLAGDIAPLIVSTESPWRRKPEARLSGFRPASAEFLERATAIGAALFPQGRPVELSMTALAQRGAATISLGGVAVPVRTTGAPGTLAWPGREPSAGFAIAFAEGGVGARRDWPGPWGLLRFLDGLRLRARDDGQRYLLDVRVGGQRAYLELTFDRPANPASARALLDGLACPSVL